MVGCGFACIGVDVAPAGADDELGLLLARVGAVRVAVGGRLPLETHEDWLVGVSEERLRGPSERSIEDFAASCEASALEHCGLDAWNEAGHFGEFVHGGWGVTFSDFECCECVGDFRSSAWIT
jgi:hypothetical protein